MKNVILAHLMTYGVFIAIFGLTFRENSIPFIYYVAAIAAVSFVVTLIIRRQARKDKEVDGSFYNQVIAAHQRQVTADVQKQTALEQEWELVSSRIYLPDGSHYDTPLPSSDTLSEAETLPDGRRIYLEPMDIGEALNIDTYYEHRARYMAEWKRRST